MTPTTLRAALTSLGWSQRHLAAMLGCDDRLTRRWASGGAPIPAPVSAWLATIAAAHDLNPPPADWRVMRQRADFERDKAAQK